MYILLTLTDNIYESYYIGWEYTTTVSLCI